MKKTFLISTITMILLSLINEAVSFEAILILRKIAVFLMVLTGLSFARSFTRILTITVLMISLTLGFIYNIEFTEIIRGITNNVPLAVLFMTVPFISIPIRRGGYLDSINSYFKKFSGSPGKFFSIVSFILFAVGSLTNLGSVRIVNDILSDSKMPDKFLARSYGAGFGACMVWSPYFAGVSLAITYAGISYLQFLPYGLFFAFLIIILGLILFSFDSKAKAELDARLVSLEIPAEINEEQAKRNIRILVINFFVLLIFVVTGERIFNFSSIMYLVSMISLIYGSIWLYLVTCKACFFEDVKSHGSRMLQAVNEVILFLMVGVLATAISLTPIKEFLTNFFIGTASYNKFLMIEIIIFSVVFLAIIGVHQIVSITVLGSILTPLSLGITPVAYSIMFISCWLLSALASPFGPFNLVLSEVLNKNIFSIPFKYNRLFSMGLLLLSGAYILLLT